MTPPLTLTIFLASPGDTAPEREHVVALVENINHDPRYREHVQLRLCRCDDAMRPVPFSINEDPQTLIGRYAGTPSECDLVIALLRHTLGSPRAESFPVKPNGEPWRGTEWEIEDGFEAGVEVQVYLDDSPFVPGGRPSQDDHDRLQTWLARRKSAGGATQWSPNRHQRRDFEETFDRKLREWVARRIGGPLQTIERLTPEQQTLFDFLVQHGDDEHPEPRLTAAVAAVRPTGLVSYLLHRYVWWTAADHGRIDRRFVNLHLLTDRGREFDGERYERRPYESLDRMFEENLAADGWVLVGEPGAGKSVLLQHYEQTSARRALRCLAGGEAPAEVCVWQRLAEYRHAPDRSPADWLEQQWSEAYAQLPPLQDWRKRLRLRYLLDGLNEMKTADSAAHGAAVHAWTAWARGSKMSNPAAVFSVRTLEYSESLSEEGFAVRVADLARWTKDQVEQYCEQRLGADNPLWPRIDRDAKLLEFCSLPFNLAAQCELYEQLHRPAANRAELMSGIAWLRLRRALQRRELDAPGLLAGQDRTLLQHDSYWRDHLFALPCEGTLVATLDLQAEQMHRASGGAEIVAARDQVAAFLREDERSAWLDAIRKLGLSGQEQGGGFRFVHQLWQEFFAARAIKDQPEHLPGVEPPPLAPLADEVARIGLREPLPGPGVTPWEEAIKLAVQLSGAPARWVEALLDRNLALAGRAAQPVAAKLPAELLQRVKQALLDRSRDPATDLRLRIEAADALGDLGDDLRYREGQGPDGQRYLLPRDDYWQAVPGDTYTIGSEEGDPDERPPVKVALAPFAIAFAPVTNAEFACFVDGGGYEERWWVGETAQRWWRGELADEERISYWREAYRALRGDFDTAVAQYWSNRTRSGEEMLRERALWSDAELEGNLQYWYGAAEHRLPQLWGDPRFNRPLLPVVGVSLFEAQAYCRWLAAMSGRPLRLPTESEWEAAARRDTGGNTGRPWPWGNGAPDPWRMNADAAHLRRISPVGVFPAADSPDGLTDLAGNVWEWTLSEYTPAPDAVALAREAPEGTVARAVRGGSWYDDPGLCRAAFRYWDHPDDRLDLLGFRVVCCPIQIPEP
jgi:formylglycine-generating enzyme required for sulfatase activity